MIQLLENQTIDTSGSQLSQDTQNTLLMGEYRTVTAWGTWDGATVTLEFSPDEGTTWIACGDDTTFTADGGGNLYVAPQGILLRGSVTSAGASTDVNLSMT